MVTNKFPAGMAICTLCYFGSKCTEYEDLGVYEPWGHCTPQRTEELQWRIDHKGSTTELELRKQKPGYVGVLRKFVVLEIWQIEHFQGKLLGTVFMKEWETFYVFVDKLKAVKRKSRTRDKKDGTRSRSLKLGWKTAASSEAEEGREEVIEWLREIWL